MTAQAHTDALLFEVSPEELLLGLRDATTGSALDGRTEYLLRRVGLMSGEGELTEAGRALFKLSWVIRSKKDSEVALGQALRQLTPVQVVEQELHGLGPVPEEGVLDLLVQHKAIAAQTDVARLRPMFRWLNSVGVLVYSQKMKSVRALAPTPEAALAGEVQAIAAMISPKTPYLNVVKLRRVLRQLHGTIWWVDPHFGARALEELAEELDPSRVQAIRILSGDADNVVSPRSKKDLDRFTAEMGNTGIVVEWRVDPKGSRDWHDRWLAGDSGEWNVPPINTLFKNDYSEIYPASERPPLDDWWKRSTPR